MSSVGLTHNGSDAVGTGDGPGKEGNGGDGGIDRLDCKEMPDLMNGEPDCR